MRKAFALLCGAESQARTVDRHHQKHGILEDHDEGLEDSAPENCLHAFVLNIERGTPAVITRLLAKALRLNLFVSDRVVSKNILQ